MTTQVFAKLLSENDVGTTGSHQAGIHVPKSDEDLLSFFPQLDPKQRNPDAWIVVEDESGREWKLRYVYYNNSLHSPQGTRREYRLTHLREYLRLMHAKAGDFLVFSRNSSPGHYRVAIQKLGVRDDGVITLRGWRRVH